MNIHTTKTQRHIASLWGAMMRLTKRSMPEGVIHGDCLDELKKLPDNSVDCLVSDPPYFLINDSGSGFMGKTWDGIIHLWKYLWSGKEFAQYASGFLSALLVEQNGAEPSTVLFRASSSVHAGPTTGAVPHAPTHSAHIAHLKSDFAHLLVITRAELSAWLRELSLGLTETEVASLLGGSDNAQFVLPLSLLKRKHTGDAAGNALNALTRSLCAGPTTQLSLTDAARINAAIAATTGNKSDWKFTLATAGLANYVASTAANEKFSATTFIPTDKAEVMKCLTLLLFALSATRSSKETQYSLIDNFFTVVWRECLRVMKPGAFSFICMTPRQDIVSRAMLSMQTAGFDTNFTSIYWTYASGFPKAMNIGKAVDKRNGRAVDPAVKAYLNERREALGLSLNRINELLGTATNGGGVASALMGNKTFNELPTLPIYKQLKTILQLDNRFDELIEREEAQREVIGQRKAFEAGKGGTSYAKEGGWASSVIDDTIPATPQAKALDGSYGGFQPKPAVEVCIVAMKPLSEKTFVDQALKNGKGVTWLDDCRVPTAPGDEGDPNRFLSGKPIRSDSTYAQDEYSKTMIRTKPVNFSRGRFPANLLVSDDVLNDGRERKSSGIYDNQSQPHSNLYGATANTNTSMYADTGSYSRYFDLDTWYAKTVLTDGSYEDAAPTEVGKDIACPSSIAPTFPFLVVPKAAKREKGADNKHPTVKPLKLMSYLITLGSRPGDTVLDPFLGSGTTAIAAKQLDRKYVGIEREAEYVKIAAARIEAAKAPEKTLFAAE